MVENKPQKTFWTGLPPSIGKKFVGRNEDLKNITSLMLEKQACVISGGPACGKSRLAAEYVRSQKVNGFWTTAGSTPILTLNALAPALGIEPQDRKKEDIVEEVKLCLQSLDKPIFWVIDNLPDLDIINALLAEIDDVRILVTTQDNRKELLLSTIGFIRIDALSPEASLELLCSGSKKIDRSNRSLLLIAERVGYLPLALEMLAVCLAKHLRTPEEVLFDIDKPPTAIQLEEFQKAVGITIPRMEGVFAAITCALKGLSKEVRRSLECLAYLDDAPISRVLAIALIGLDGKGIQQLIKACVRENIVSYFNRNLIIHSLTLAAIGATNSKDALTRALSHYVNRLAAIHIDDPIALRKEIMHYERFFALIRDNLPQDNEKVLKFRDYLAIAYCTIGRHDEAIPIHEETLRIKERVLGPDHPDTLASRNNLAATYINVGRYDEAIPVHEENFKIMQQALGPEHFNTLLGRNYLAEAYRFAGRYDEAILIHEENIRIIVHAFGPEHPLNVLCRNNLANAYCDAGRYDQAISIHEETLMIIERLFGVEHPRALSIRNNLENARRAAREKKG